MSFECFSLISQSSEGDPVIVMLEAKHKSRPSCSEALGLQVFGKRDRSSSDVIH